MNLLLYMILSISLNGKCNEPSFVLKPFQKSVIEKSDNDTLSITDIFIKAHQLFDYMNKYNKDSFSLSAAVQIIKIYNTFTYVEISKRDSVFVNAYSKKFIHEYYPSVEANLQMTFGVGVTLYAKAVDMYIGFSMDLNRKDYYVFWKIDAEGKRQVLE